MGAGGGAGGDDLNGDADPIAETHGRWRANRHAGDAVRKP
jgi:hypothetical protein